MSGDSKRISITIPIELQHKLDSLKKEGFYKESYSEMLRYLIEVGLQKSKESKED